MSNEQLFDRYLERTLTEEESGLLLARLDADAEFRKAFLSHVTDIALMINAGSRLEMADRASRWSLGMGRVKRPALRWRLVSIPLVLAASLAIVAGVWWLLPDPSLGLRVAEVSGEANIQHSTSNIQHPNGERNGRQAVVGMELRRGDRVMVPEGGKAVLKYDDEETTLALHSGMATFGAAGGAKRAKLESGLLVCAVARQKRPFLLETPHGVAEVVGTHFSLSANAAQTTLAVQEGQVTLRQDERKLDVKNGETAAADVSVLRKLSPADAWIRELLVRAETGPWDVVNLGTGVYSNDVWRMDARGGPAERRIWNMPLESDRAGMVSFRDGKRWVRGVVMCRMMILPDGQLSLDVGGATLATNIAWRTYNFGMVGAPDDWHMSRKASVNLSFGPPGRERTWSCGILSSDRDLVGGWYRFAVYFDTETPDGLRCVHAAWPDDDAPLSASEWTVKRDKGFGSAKVEFGLMAKGVLMEAQGFKFVPLDADMPLPPKELLDRK